MMKKILGSLILSIVFILVPINAEAKSEVAIYFFRGDGCHVCEEALDYINKHKDEIDDGIKLVTLEVWSNSNNAALQDIIADRLEVDKKDNYGTPFIVIGDEYIKGYGGPSTFQDILDLARKFKNGEKEYVDVVEEEKKENNITTEVLSLNDLYSEPNKLVTIIVYSVFGVIVLGIIGMILFSRK